MKETSTFGSELVAARITTELTMELRYKLHMLGIPLRDNATVLFGDNQGVIMNTSLPSSSLKKRHNAISYHFVREAVAANILRLVYLPTNLNISDILTKAITPTKLRNLIWPILFETTPVSGE